MKKSKNAPPQTTRESLTLRQYLDSLVEERLEESTEPEEESELWVSFVLGEETFGLPVQRIKEVLRVGSITQVPRAPRVLRGVTNMRGRVLGVVDLRIRLGMKRVEISEGSRILVADGPSGVVGLLVDRVEQMEQIFPSEILEAPSSSPSASSLRRGVVSRDLGMLVLLDLGPLLQSNEIA